MKWGVWAVSLFLFVMTVVPLSASGKGDSRGAKVGYSITFSREGTRSEARHHHLLINGRPVPEVFQSLTVNGRYFVFMQRSMLWGDDGYVLVEKDPESGEENTEELTEEEKKVGWSVTEKRKKGTPSDWCRVETGDMVAYVDPGHLDDFAAFFRLKRLPREILEEKMKKND